MLWSADSVGGDKCKTNEASARQNPPPHWNAQEAKLPQGQRSPGSGPRRGCPRGLPRPSSAVASGHLGPVAYRMSAGFQQEGRFAKEVDAIEDGDGDYVGNTRNNGAVLIDTSKL